MNISSSVISQDDSPFDYLEIHDFQRRISELQKANLNLKMSLIEQENRMTKIMADGSVNQSVITEFIQNTKTFNDLNSQIRNLTFELDEAKMTITDLRTKEENQKEIKKQLQNEIQILKSTNQIFDNNETSDSNRTVIQLKLEISKLKQDIASQEARNAELTVEILNLQSRLNDYENDEKRNDSEVNRVKLLLSDTQNELMKAKEENMILQNQIKLFNQQITEKNEKIKKKSKKIHAFKQVVQNNMNEIQACTVKFKKRASKIQKQMDDFLKSSNEKMNSTKERCESIQKSIVSTTKIVLNNSKKKYQSKIARQSNVIHDLASLSARIVNIPQSNIPKIDDIINNESDIELFIGRINAAYEMQKDSIQSNIDKIEAEFKKNQKKNELSSKVSIFVNQMQNTLNNMTNTLHKDHLQLIDALTTNDHDISD